MRADEAKLLNWRYDPAPVCRTYDTFGNIWYDPVAEKWLMVCHDTAAGTIVQYQSDNPRGPWGARATALGTGAEGAWDETETGVPFAWYEAGEARPWRMIYRGKNAASYCQIGLATAEDTVDEAMPVWERLDTAGDAAVVGIALGGAGAWDISGMDFSGIIKITAKAGEFAGVDVGTELYLCYYNTISPPREVGLAWSTDLVTWTKHSSNPLLRAMRDYEDSTTSPLSASSIATNGATPARWRFTTAAAHGLAQGQQVLVEGATGTGAANVNGRWYVDVINSTSFDLRSSSVSGTYTGGATATPINNTCGYFCGDMVRWDRDDGTERYVYFVPHYEAGSGHAGMEVFVSPSCVLTKVNRTYIGRAFRTNDSETWIWQGSRIGYSGLDTPAIVTDDISRNVITSTLTGNDVVLLCALYANPGYTQSYLIHHKILHGADLKNVWADLPVSAPRHQLAPRAVSSSTLGLWLPGQTRSLRDLSDRGEMHLGGMWTAIDEKGVKLTRTSKTVGEAAEFNPWSGIVSQLAYILDNFTIECRVALAAQFSDSERRCLVYCGTIGGGGGTTFKFLVELVPATEAEKYRLSVTYTHYETGTLTDRGTMTDATGFAMVTGVPYRFCVQKSGIEALTGSGKPYLSLWMETDPVNAPGAMVNLKSVGGYSGTGLLSFAAVGTSKMRFMLGGQPLATDTKGLSGWIDEVRISHQARYAPMYIDGGSEYNTGNSAWNYTLSPCPIVPHYHTHGAIVLPPNDPADGSRVAGAIALDGDGSTSPSVDDLTGLVSASGGGMLVID